MCQVNVSGVYTIHKQLHQPPMCVCVYQQSLEHNPAYVELAKQTVKKRMETKNTKEFKTIRRPIRSSAAAARKAYVRAAEAQPDAPDVRNMLQVVLPGSCVEVVPPGNHSHVSSPGTYTR